jgi:hypothetical protein
VYGFHNRAKVRVTCYCLNANDRSEWRIKIESSAERFMDLQVRVELGSKNSSFDLVSSHKRTQIVVLSR